MLFLLYPLLSAADPPEQKYLVYRYSNNPGHGFAIDQLIRLINTGQQGTPLTSPVGDVCANIYVFDNEQTMIACCSCRLTPNELASASVAEQLTRNTLTGFVPRSGTVAILPVAATTATCDATDQSVSDVSLLAGYGTHVVTSGATTSISETTLPALPLSQAEAAFLPQTCTFVKFLGSGQGTCGCSAPGE